MTEKGVNSMNKVKFSVFADLHNDERWTSDGDERLDFILERAKKENCDFIVELGDFVHYPDKKKEFVDRYNNFEIPTYHVLGNHDSDNLSLEDTVKCYNMPHEYYYFDKNGFRFIALNSNYYRYEGEDIPYQKGNYYKFREYRDYISQEQLNWLEDVVMSSPYPMVIMSHGSLSLEDKNADALKNREDVQNIIRKAHNNNKRILMCLNGHFHVDYMRIYEHVCYFDVNSACMYWTPTEHHLFPDEFHKAHEGAKKIAIYNDPIHAIITLTDDGTIEIEGMKSSFFYGVTKEMIEGTDCYSCRKSTPNVMSEKIKLPIEL